MIFKKRFLANKGLSIGLSLLLIVYIYLAVKNNVVFLADTYGFFYRGYLLSTTSIWDWVHGFYPFGYPFLVKLLSFVTLDYLISAKIISILSALVTCWAVYQISIFLFKDKLQALFSMLMLGLNSTFLLYAPTDNTDMATLVFMTLGLLYLLKSGETNNIKDVIFTGVFLGLSYLMRYTALIIVPMAVLWLMFSSENNSDDKKRNILILIIIFLLVISPQLIISHITFDKPFYNLQYQNVWFGMYGENNWGLNWNKSAEFSSLGEVIQINPLHFLKHVANQLWISMHDNLYDIPLHALSFLGFFAAILNKESRKRAIFLFLLSISFCAAISMAFVNSRVTIFYLVIKILYFPYGVKYLLHFGYDRYQPFYKKIVPIMFCVLFILNISQVFHPRFIAYFRPETKDIIAVSDRLHKSGMKSTKEVMSFSDFYYDTQSKIKQDFERPWYKEGAKPFTSYQNLRDFMLKNRLRYIVYDNASPEIVPGLKDFWSFDSFPSDFESIYQNWHTGVLKIRDDVFWNAKIATIHNFNDFLNTNPCPNINAHSYSGDAKEVYFRLFEELGDWKGEEWHRDNVLPFWREYKFKKGLL